MVLTEALSGLPNVFNQRKREKRRKAVGCVPTTAW